MTLASPLPAQRDTCSSTAVCFARTFTGQRECGCCQGQRRRHRYGRGAPSSPVVLEQSEGRNPLRPCRSRWLRTPGAPCEHFGERADSGGICSNQTPRSRKDADPFLAISLPWFTCPRDYLLVAPSAAPRSHRTQQRSQSRCCQREHRDRDAHAFVQRHGCRGVTTSLRPHSFGLCICSPAAGAGGTRAQDVEENAQALYCQADSRPA